MFKYRIISFFGLLAIFGGIIYSGISGHGVIGITLFAAAFSISGGMVAFELARMLDKSGAPSFPVFSGVLTAVVILWTASAFGGSLTDYDLPVLLVSTVFLLLVALPYLLLSALLFLGEKRTVYLKKLFGSAGPVLFGLGVVLPLAIVYAGVYARWDMEFGARSLMYLVLVTKAMDTGGYVFGMASSRLLKEGNHKIVPSISPGKSYEGAAGGLLFSLGAAAAFGYFDFLDASWGFYLLSGVLLALGSFAGDLTESAIKRSCGVKDSGAILPGMGGFFDLFDSFIYNGIIFLAFFLFE